MKIVLFKTTDNNTHPGIMTENGVIDISSLYDNKGFSGQEVIVDVIDSFESNSQDISNIVENNDAISFESIQLIPTLPRPSKILCCIGNYW